ncbi:MAG TPA: flagellar export chaperone FliS [Bryobacteraceae bacterium]|nr:flagellar export chaperone FliS [Bryobacteraceae bacterium]
MSKGYQNYFDQEVLTANPVRLVELLYRGALDSIASARRHLASGNIRARSKAIAKTMEIVTELSLSLNQEAGGELSQTLAELYAYTETLLIEANARQTDPPLAEAERLLSTLAEAWGKCAQAASGPVNATAAPREEYQPVSCAY